MVENVAWGARAIKLAKKLSYVFLFDCLDKSS